MSTHTSLSKVTVAKIVLVAGFFVALGVRLLIHLHQHQQAAVVNTRTLAHLLSDRIRLISLYPVPAAQSLIKKPVVLRDPHTIATLVGAYQQLSPQRPGDGRLPGSWQVRVVFTTDRQQEISSIVYHTDFADLVFLPTPDRSTPRSPEDLYASRELSTILLHALKP